MRDNGDAPAHVAGPGLAAHIEAAQRTRASVVSELRALHESEQRILDELAKQTAESKARRDSYKRALDQLGAPPERVAKADDNSKPKAKTRVYRPKDRYLDEVMTALRASGEPLTHSELVAHEDVTMSAETLSRALRVLREEGRVRIARRVGQRPYYAAMPDGD